MDNSTSAELEAQRDVLVKMWGVLTSIDQGKPKFFNTTQYQKMGLVFSRNKWGKSATGNRIVIGTTWHLTEKGRRAMNNIAQTF